MYKLLALDIDGTLLTNDMKITNVTRRAIADAQEKGTIVTLATGRSFHSAKNYAEQLNIDVPLICANGALIADRQGTMVKENLLLVEIASLIREMVEAGLFIQAYHRQGIYTAGHKLSLFNWIQVICDNKLKLSHLAYSVVEYWRCSIKYSCRLPEMIEARQVSPHKLFCSGSPGKLDYYQRRAAELGLTVEYYPGYRGRMYLEIMPANTSKGNALKTLAAHLGLPVTETVAVGDNLNDLSMISAAGLGVAMGNAHAQLKQAADYVTQSNEKDGIAALIRGEILVPEVPRSVV